MGWDDIKDEPYLSASQLSMYTRCPKQYEYRYMKGIKRPPNLNMIVGTSVHASAEVNYGSKFKKKKPVTLDVALDAFSTAWRKNKADAEDEGKTKEGTQKDRGVAMSKSHYLEIAPKWQPVEEPELEFTVAIPGVKRKLYGFIDVIASPVVAVPGPLKLKRAEPLRMVRDNKTSGRKYDKLSVEVSGQLTAYEHVHRELFGKPSDGVGFDIMVADKNSTDVEVQKQTTTRTDAEITRFHQTAQAIEKGIVAGVFPPVDDQKTCSWCGYRDICLPSAMRRAAKF